LWENKHLRWHASPIEAPTLLSRPGQVPLWSMQSGGQCWNWRQASSLTWRSPCRRLAEPNIFTRGMRLLCLADPHDANVLYATQAYDVASGGGGRKRGFHALLCCLLPPSFGRLTQYPTCPLHLLPREQRCGSFPVWQQFTSVGVATCFGPALPGSLGLARWRQPEAVASVPVVLFHIRSACVTCGRCWRTRVLGVRASSACAIDCLFTSPHLSKHRGGMWTLPTS